MGRATVAGGNPVMAAPTTGIALAEIAEGSLVKILEDGAPIEFYVACHNYESGLNGTGRTLLVRKHPWGSTMAWHTSNSNYYDTSSVDEWLNSTYKNRLDADVQSAIDSTSFYYISGSSSGRKTALSRSVFMLTVQGLGASHQYDSEVEEEMPISGLLNIAYQSNGTAVTQWTRDRNTDNLTSALYVNTSGNATSTSATNKSYPRPCFTLPDTTLFDVDTLEFKEVA